MENYFKGLVNLLDKHDFTKSDFSESFVRHQTTINCVELTYYITREVTLSVTFDRSNGFDLHFHGNAQFTEDCEYFSCHLIFKTDINGKLPPEDGILTMGCYDVSIYNDETDISEKELDKLLLSRTDFCEIYYYLPVLVRKILTNPNIL